LTQYIKLGDDKTPVQLDKYGDNDGFKVVGGCAWAKEDVEITPDFLRSRVEPWLTALFQSEHLNLLVGAGLSTAVQKSATGIPPQGMGWINDLSVCKQEIDAYVVKAAKAAGREEGNIEDQIRSINELIKGLEILTVQDLPPLLPPPGCPPYRNFKDELIKLNNMPLHLAQDKCTGV